ncbi:MAG: T9SS type A sorting domain-containing protein, partial [Bacteroidota bacterium]
LQIGVDSTFGGGIFLDDANLSDTTRMVRGLKGETRYFWRVRAGNAGGWGPYSRPQAVVTWQPAGPVLVFPANAQTDVLPTTLLRWKKSLVATTYHVQLARNQDFSTIVLDTTGLADTICATPRLSSYTIYFWRVQGMNVMSIGDWSAAYRFRTMIVEAVEPDDALPREYNLFQNYPNPFNPATTIRFALPRQIKVRMTIYDVLGREVSVLIDDTLAAGYHSVVWNANVATGVYFVRLQAGGYTATKQMLFLK